MTHAHPGAGLAGQVTTYNVVISGGQTVYNVGGVRKRYSEFEALRMALEKRYAGEGLLIPALPPKKMMGNQDHEFVKARMRGLTLFVEALACNPFLMSDSTFERFVSHGDGVEVSMDADDPNNVGFQKWIEFLGTFALPTDADTQLNKVRATSAHCPEKFVAVIHEEYGGSMRLRGYPRVRAFVR
jgi:hypothetical protein